MMARSNLIQQEVPIARRVFEMRDESSRSQRSGQMLKSHGIKRSHRGVQVMLASRVYLGEIHFGNLVNLKAHDPIIDRDLWNRVQKMVIPRGRKPVSRPPACTAGDSALWLLWLAAIPDETSEAKQLPGLPLSFNERLSSSRHHLSGDRREGRHRCR